MDIMSCIPTNMYPMDAAMMAMQMSPRTDLCASGMASDPPASAKTAARRGLDAGSHQPGARLQHEIRGEDIADQGQPVFHRRPHVDHGSLLNQGHDPQMAEPAPPSVSLPNPDDDRRGCRDVNDQPDMRREQLQAKRHGRVHVEHSEQHRDMSAMVPATLPMHADQMTAVENQHDAKRRDPDSRSCGGEQTRVRRHHHGLIMAWPAPPLRWTRIALSYGAGAPLLPLWEEVARRSRVG